MRLAMRILDSMASLDQSTWTRVSILDPLTWEIFFLTHDCRIGERYPESRTGDDRADAGQTSIGGNYQRRSTQNAPEPP